MKNNLTLGLCLLLFAVLIAGCSNKREGKPKVLLFKKTAQKVNKSSALVESEARPR